MITVPVQLNEADLEKIDYLVRLGHYKNRNQAIKIMLTEHIRQEASFAELDKPENPELYEKLRSELKKKPPLLFSIADGKPIEDIVSEFRARN